MKFIYLNYKTLLSVLIILIVGVYLYHRFIRDTKEGYENEEKQFLDSQEDYYKERDTDTSDSALDTSDADKFYTFDSSKPDGKQLVMKDDVGAPTSYSNVDEEVKKCASLTSCKQLDNTNCGYCKKTGKFHYGNKDGPYTDVCSDGWVTSSSECSQQDERDICAKVTSCHEMVGNASICAWCNSKNKAFVYKEVDGNIVPKYPDKDQCGTLGIDGSVIGLTKQSKCDSFSTEYPCLGPNAETGPHSQQCLDKLWRTAGGSVRGSDAPSKGQEQLARWNQSGGWKNVLENMKQDVNNANSPEWSVASQAYKGVYGTQPNPCDGKYNGPLECYQTIFTQQGCSDKGSGYPTQKPNETTQSFTTYVKKLLGLSRDESISYKERNDAYTKCHGGSLPKPPSIKVGDKVKYEVTLGSGFDAVCADVAAHSLVVFEGYVCKKYGSTCQVIWESVTNPNPGPVCKGYSSRTWKRTESGPNEWIKTYLGLCHKEPTYYNGKVKSAIDESELTLVYSCNESSTCADSECNMECIAVISNAPKVSYNVSKRDVVTVINKLRGKYPDATICQKSDMEYLVENNLPYCACGWFEQNGSLTSGYPSSEKTSKGCGGGKKQIISCGYNGPSWAKGKAAIYIKVSANPSTFMKELKEINLAGSIISVVGKNEYNSLLA